MSKPVSCGILLYRFVPQLQVMLAHAGGDHNKHIDVWGMPKGMQDDTDDDFLQTAIREFKEETTIELDPTASYLYLGTNQNYANRKAVRAYGHPLDVDVSNCISNQCEYPVGSGIMIPEVDAYRWFDLEEAERKMHPKQRQFLTKLCDELIKESAY